MSRKWIRTKRKWLREVRERDEWLRIELACGYTPRTRRFDARGIPGDTIY